ncbi:MAG: ABC transporter ATP-binding protein [Phycisphaerae bacterium]
MFFIAGLWGSGLGMMLPAVKILISDEGLHGWVYNTVVNERLNAQVEQVPVSPEWWQEKVHLPLEGPGATKSLQVIKVDNGPARKAGLRPRMYILGIEPMASAATQPVSAQAFSGSVFPKEPSVLLKQLANLDPDVDYQLIAQNDRRVVLLTVGKVAEEPGFFSGLRQRVQSKGIAWLAGIARAIPEPVDYGGRQTMFLWLLAIVLVTNAIRCLFTFVQEYLVGTAIWLGIMDLRCENYNKVLHLPTAFFSEKGVSDATSRFIQDTNELARGQNTLLGKTMVEPAKALGALVAALMLSWQLTLLAMIAGPPAYFIIRSLGKSMHRASRRALESWSMMLAVLGETLQGIRVVKAYTMEGSERRRFFLVNRKLVKQQIKMERLDATTGPSIELLGLVAGLAAAGVAGALVFKGMNIFGEFYKMDRFYFIAWLGALFALFDPVRKLAKVTTRFQQSDAAAKRIFELMDTPPEPIAPNAPTLPPHHQSIEFRNVSFRYPSASDDSVKNASLFVKAGQTVAIVGPNGSGKTTLLSLVPRLFDPTAGQIFIDGTDISQVSVRSLRRQIGLVTQDSVMFAATIGENISYGLRRPRQEDVLAAAKKAFVDEIVARLPNGYDTMVGEHGATLSGGEKQRIAIARAILRNPAILIFDEAMSQVDSDSESRIHQAMAEFIKGRTTLLIAHRFATVLAADVIAVMEKGVILDTGTHKELVERCEVYRHLYRTQFIDSGGQ